MPTFEVEAQGKNYHIEAPDFGAAMRALGMDGKGVEVPPSQPASEPSTLADVAKSAGTGLVSGVAGLPGNVAALGGLGVDLAAKAFMSPERYAVHEARRAAAGNLLPTSGDIADKIYTPQTTAGEYARTLGEFVPAAIGGPETLASRLATRVAAPAVASETAGQLTKGTPAEMYARMAAGMGTAAAVAKLAKIGAPTPGTMTASELKQQTGNQYDALTARNVALPIAQSELDNLAADARSTLNAKGVRPSVADSIHKAVTEIETPATQGAPDVADLVAARQNIKTLLGSPDANKAGAAMVVPKIDAAIERLSPGTMQALREADQNWSAVKASEALDKKVARAELRTAGEHSGLNLGNKIRQQVTNYLMSNEARYLSPQNRTALEKIVKGTITENTARFLSNLMGGGGGLGSTLLGLGGAVAGTATGNPAMALVPAAGIGLRMGANAMTARTAAKAGEQIRANSPMGKQRAAAAPVQAQLSPGQTAAILALLSAQGANAMPILAGQPPVLTPR